MIIKDIAQYEETDSQLAKNTICDLTIENQELKEELKNASNNYTKYIQERDKVIEEVREYIEKNLYEEDNGCGCYWQQFGDYNDAKSELLQILDKVTNYKPIPLEEVDEYFLSDNEELWED